MTFIHWFWLIFSLSLFLVCIKDINTNNLNRKLAAFLPLCMTKVIFSMDINRLLKYPTPGVDGSNKRCEHDEQKKWSNLIYGTWTFLWHIQNGSWYGKKSVAVWSVDNVLGVDFGGGNSVWIFVRASPRFNVVVRIERGMLYQCDK